MAEDADDDSGEFEEEIAQTQKEERQQKAVAILRKHGHEEVAKVVLGEANPEDFMDELQSAADSEEIFSGVKNEWIYPIIREIEKSDAADAFEEWAKCILGGTGILQNNPTKDNVSRAKEALKEAWDVDLGPYLWHIEQMIIEGEYPKTINCLFESFRDMADAAVSAQQADHRKASVLITEIRRVIENAISVFDQTVLDERFAAKSTKTQQYKESHPNAEAQRRANQLERAGESLSMKGHNPSADKIGKGKKSKRAENDPNHNMGKGAK